MKFYLLGTLLFVALAVSAQNRERTVSGQLKSNRDGSPLVGVNIVIKGTPNGTVTDANGRYSISVPIGSILRFSFVGMETREVLVTETSLEGVNGDIRVRVKSQKQNWDPSILVDTVMQHTEGVATLDHNTSTYKIWTATLNPDYIVSIRRPLWSLFSKGTKKYYVNTNYDRYNPKGFGVQFSSSIGINTHTQLPKLQSTFGQGPVPNMSWGPQVGGASTYNPYKFFRTGVSTSYDVGFWFPGLVRSLANVNVSRKNNQGIVTNNDYSIDNISMTMKKMNFSRRLKGDVNFLYNASRGTLMNRASNISNIIGSMMLTPPTFDASYKNPDGTVRSAAPGVIDNPYGLVSTLPDRERSSRILSGLGLTYNDDDNNFDVTLNASGEHQHSNIVYGVRPGYSPYVAGRRTERNETRNDYGVGMTASYRIERSYKRETTFGVGYQFRQEQRSVSRRDGFGYTNENFNSIQSADSLSTFDFALTRNIQEVSENIQFKFDGLDARFINRNYFSNTAKNYVNLFPSLGLKWNIEETWGIDGFQRISPFYSISRNIRESPAIFGNQAMLSTRYAAQQYNQYFENREITWNKQISPETEWKQELGGSVSPDFGWLNIDFSYYINTTSNLVLPVWTNNNPVLTNAATVRNNGWNVSLSYRPWSYAITWGVDLRWTKYNTVVTSMDLPNEYLPIAGFSDVQTVVAKGQQLGAIYGTTWLRDSNGNQVIGNDGFPVVDPTLRKIGNPIPKYMIALESFFKWHNFKVGFIMDFKKGGQVWNGTRAALNYSGRSQETADYRDPATPYQQNRWVRYGFGGVGEDHIENASWIRLNEVNASHSFLLKHTRGRKELIVAFVAKNLFLITPYSGVDPGTTLFGYSNGTGLDLFNSPSLRTYNFSVTIKL